MLRTTIKPWFIDVHHEEHEDNLYISVIVVRPEFRSMSVQERQEAFFSLLEDELNDIVKGYIVVAQLFSPKEFTEITNENSETSN
jgi:stress-induced morphogen